MPTVSGRTALVTSRLAGTTISFANIADTTLTVNWLATPNATEYTLQRSTAIDFSLNLTTRFVGFALTFNDTGLGINTQYYYRIISRSGAYIDSYYSANSVTTTGGGGAQLATPVVSRLGMGSTSISIEWAGTAANVTGYIVQRATNAGFTTGLTTLYSGVTSGVVRTFQPGFTLEYHDSDLIPGTTYHYRVAATASGFTQSNWSVTKTYTTPTATRTLNISGPNLFFDINNDTNPLQVYDPGTNTVYDVGAGDTLAVNPASGGQDWGYFSLINLHGTPTQPITIRNQGQIVLSAGFQFRHSSHFTIDGGHASKAGKTKVIDGVNVPLGGFEIMGSGGGPCVEFIGMMRHAKLLNVYTEGGGYQIRCKNEANTFVSDNLPDCGQKFMWPSRIHDIEVAFCVGWELSQDGHYWGSSGPWGGRPFNCAGMGGTLVDFRPTGLANILCHDNTLAYCGRSALQLGSMDTGTNIFYNNKLIESGFEYAADQGAGMAIGGAVGSLEIYNTTIKKSYRESIYSYAFGLQNWHDITTVDAGYISVRNDRVFFWTQIDATGLTLSNLWDGQGGKTVRDNLGEYFFEYFHTVGNIRQIKSIRIDDKAVGVKRTIPTTTGGSITFPVSGGTYAFGQKVKVVVNTNEGSYIKGTVTAYDGATLTFTVDEFSGTGTFYSWQVYKETRTALQAIIAIGQTAPGSHAGTQADPYEGFGSSAPLTVSNTAYMTEISIPGSGSVGSLMMNCFTADSVNVYGDPAGRTRFTFSNMNLGNQRAASNSVIRFLNTYNLYGTPNDICGVTYLGSPLTEANINKPAGGVVTYTLSNSCT